MTDQGIGGSCSARRTAEAVDKEVGGIRPMSSGTWATSYADAEQSRPGTQDTRGADRKHPADRTERVARFLSHDESALGQVPHLLLSLTFAVDMDARMSWWGSREHVGKEGRGPDGMRTNDRTDFATLCVRVSVTKKGNQSQVVNKELFTASVRLHELPTGSCITTYCMDAPKPNALLMASLVKEVSGFRADHFHAGSGVARDGNARPILPTT